MSSELGGLSPGSSYRSSESWEWAHEDDQSDEARRIEPGAVCAVMVVHNAEEWLQRQLSSLEALEPRPGTILVVDNGSTDGSQELLRRALDDRVVNSVIQGDAKQGFGAAVSQALRGRPTPEWIWLLHDDSEPKRGALAELLLCANDRGADVLTPKLLMPKRRNYPDQLLEVGRSISSLGRKVVSVEVGDIDQHQLDPSLALGGSTAGMLIRGSVWDSLGGLDPDLPLFWDGVDLGWRANEAGYRVLSCPQAALYHRQSGRLGWRKSQLAPRSQAADRKMAMQMILARSSRPRRTALLLWVTCLLRAIGFLLGKSPSRARDELTAIGALNSAKEQTARIRSRLETNRGTELGRADRLRPARFDGLRNLVDQAAGTMVERYRDLISTESDVSIDDLTGEDFDGGLNRVSRHFAPILIVSIVLFIAGIVAGRGWISTGTLSGGNLLPAPSSLSAAWQAFLVPTPGVPGSSPLWLGIMAVGSTVTFGQPAIFIVVLLMFAPLFAAWSANLLLRMLVDSDWLRAALACVWGASVWLFGLPQSGSLTGIACAIGMPMFVRAVLRWRERGSEGAERWRGPAAAAGWLILLAAAYPIIWLITVAAGLVWLIRERVRWPEISAAIVGSLVFMAGWLPALLAYPGRWITGVDPLAGPDYVVGPTMLIGEINRGSLNRIPAAVIIAALVVSAGWLLISRRSGGRGLVAVLTFGGGLVVSAALSRIVVPVDGGWVRPEITPWMLLSCAAVLAAFVLSSGAEERPGWQGAVLSGVCGIAVIWTSVVGTSGIVRPEATSLPSYVVTVQDSFRRTRTLIITLDSSEARWSLVSAEQPRWGSAEHDLISADPEISKTLRRLAQSISRAQLDQDSAGLLSAMGVGHVMVRGANPEQVAAISNTSGMTRAAADDNTQVWTVTGLASRAQVQSGSQFAPLPASVLPAGQEGRRLVLAEPKDPRWQADIDGVALPVSEDASKQTFLLPAEGGQITWRMAQGTTYLIIQLVTAALLIVLAAPVVGSATHARRGRED